MTIHLVAYSPLHIPYATAKAETQFEVNAMALAVYEPVTEEAYRDAKASIKARKTGKKAGRNGR